MVATIKVGNGRMNVADHHAGDTASFSCAVPGDLTSLTWTAWLRHNALQDPMPLAVTAPVYTVLTDTTAFEVALDLDRAPLVKPGDHRWRLHRQGPTISKTTLSGEWQTEPADG